MKEDPQLVIEYERLLSQMVQLIAEIQQIANGCVKRTEIDTAHSLIKLLEKHEILR